MPESLEELFHCEKSMMSSLCPTVDAERTTVRAQRCLCQAPVRFNHPKCQRGWFALSGNFEPEMEVQVPC